MKPSLIFSMRIMLSLILLVPITTTFVYGEGSTRQEHVHQMAHSVMPFDISTSIHFFRMSESGGVMRVIVKDPGAVDQIELIQQHLQHEALMFQQGNYSDPGKLHGPEMVGIKELVAGASRINVRYKAVPSGAEIAFETGEIGLITAIHRWFGAQLSEHGTDARPE